MAIDPPMYEDRRRLPDRRRASEPVADQTPVLRTAVAAVIAIAGGLVLIYIFFGTIGAVDFREAAVATIVTVAMAAVWLAGSWYRQRTLHPRDPSTADRERRGF